MSCARFLIIIDIETRRGFPRSSRIRRASPADHLPSGDGWIHEIKHDGYRLIRILSAEPEPPEIVPCCIRCGGTGHNKSAAPPLTHDKALRPDNRKSDMKEWFDLWRNPRR